jgi:hypothetical protein
MSPDPTVRPRRPRRGLIVFGAFLITAAIVVLTWERLLALMLALALSGGGGKEVREQRFPSPDPAIALVERLEMGGGAAGWAFIYLLIEGAPGERAEVATLRHGGVAGARWTAADRISVCVEQDTDVDTWTGRVVVETTGGQRLITVERKCPA